VTEATCKECKSNNLKYDGLLVHDLRRSSVRNLRRLGFAEKIIMEISGHKTAQVFRRYDIVDESDLASGSISVGSQESSSNWKKSSQLRHNSASSSEALKTDSAGNARIQ